MKNLIYISIIAVLLSACKSNSFMTQRYTKFAHHASKISAREKAIVRTEPLTDQQPEFLQKAETPVVASANNNFAKEDIILAYPAAGQFNNARSTITNKETENLEHSNTVVKEKKVNGQKHQVAKRIIGTLLKIVLWIIILAVVVGILLIIGALA